MYIIMPYDMCEKMRVVQKMCRKSEYCETYLQHMINQYLQVLHHWMSDCGPQFTWYRLLPSDLWGFSTHPTSAEHLHSNGQMEYLLCCYHLMAHPSPSHEALVAPTCPSPRNAPLLSPGLTSAEHVFVVTVDITALHVQNNNQKFPSTM